MSFNTETQRLKDTEEKFPSESQCLCASVLREDSEKSPNLQNSQSPSNESNKVTSAPLRLCVKNNSVCSVSSVVKNITQTAQSILDARSLYPDSSLADLYDPLTMPVELRKAHAANDAAVMKAYGYAPTMTEPEIVADLMKRYQELVVSD